MKLIDMEKVLSELCLSHKDIIYIDKNETAERIRKIPSIDIVFCKECKHAFVNENHENKPLICGLTKRCGTTDPNWYCADGEREGE